MKYIYILALVLIPSVTFASFDTNLSYGAKGDSVKELQEFLTEQGMYTGPVTGNFFTLTRSAVVKFQTTNNVTPAGGFFGPLTRARANIILSEGLEQSHDQEIKETGKITPPDTNKEITDLKKEVIKLTETIEKQNNQPKAIQFPELIPPKKKALLNITGETSAVQIGVLRYTEDPKLSVVGPEGLKMMHEYTDCAKQKTGEEICSQFQFWVLNSAVEGKVPKLPNGSYTFTINAYGKSYTDTHTMLDGEAKETDIELY